MIQRSDPDRDKDPRKQNDLNDDMEEEKESVLEKIAGYIGQSSEDEKAKSEHINEKISQLEINLKDHIVETRDRNYAHISIIFGIVAVLLSVISLGYGAITGSQISTQQNLISSLHSTANTRLHELANANYSSLKRDSEKQLRDMQDVIRKADKKMKTLEKIQSRLIRRRKRRRRY